MEQYAFTAEPQYNRPNKWKISQQIFLCFWTGISFEFCSANNRSWQLKKKLLSSIKSFIPRSYRTLKDMCHFYYNHTLSQTKLPNLMWVQDFFLIQYFLNFLCGIQGDSENTFSVPCTQLYKLLCRSIGPLVRWSVGQLVHWSVGLSVRLSLIAWSSQLIAIGLVLTETEP